MRATTALAMTSLFSAAATGVAHAQNAPREPPPSARSSLLAEIVAPGEPGGAGRLRLGLAAFGGFGTFGGVGTTMYGGTVRGGWQLDDRFGIYGHVTIFGAPFSQQRGGAESSGLVGVQLTPLVSFTPHRAFEVALGPSADGFGTSTSFAGAATRTADRLVVYSGFYAGAHGHVAWHPVVVQRRDHDERFGLTLFVDGHPTFAPGKIAAMATAGLGVDWY